MSESASPQYADTLALAALVEPTRINSSEINATETWFPIPQFLVYGDPFCSPPVASINFFKSVSTTLAWQEAKNTAPLSTLPMADSFRSASIVPHLRRKVWQTDNILANVGFTSQARASQAFYEHHSTSFGFANLASTLFQIIVCNEDDEFSESGGSNVQIRLPYFAADNPAIRLVEIQQACIRTLTRFKSAISRRVFENIHQSLSKILDPEDWENDDKLPSLDSFLHMMGFVSRHGDCRAPALTISNDGNFVATWINTRANVVRLEFRPDGFLNWLFILAPVGGSASGEQGTGDGPISKTEKVLTNFGVWGIMQAGNAR